MQKVFYNLFTNRKLIGNKWNHKIIKENQIIHTDKIIDYPKIFIHLNLKINHKYQATRISKKLIQIFWNSSRKWGLKNQ